MAKLMDMFSYSFLVRAFIAGIFISVCLAILGVVLVLKRCSMIADGISHISFSIFCVCSALKIAYIYVYMPIVVVFAIFLLLAINKRKIKADAAVVLVSTSSLAIGIITISLTKGMNIDVLNYMFGSILSLSDSDVFLSILFSMVVIFSFIFLYSRIFAVVFDEEFAKATGLNVIFYNIWLAALIAVVVVVCMKMVGALLLSSLIVFPVLSCMKFCNRYKLVVIFSAVNSVFCFVVGFFVSYIFSLPTGATIVAVNLLIFELINFLKFLTLRLNCKI